MTAITDHLMQGWGAERTAERLCLFSPAQLCSWATRAAQRQRSRAALRNSHRLWGGVKSSTRVRNVDPHSGLLLPSRKLATTMGNTSNVTLEFSFLLCVGSLIYSRIWHLQQTPGTSIRNSEIASRPLFPFSSRKWLQCLAELWRANPTKDVWNGCREQWRGVASRAGAGALQLRMERRWRGRTEPRREVRGPVAKLVGGSTWCRTLSSCLSTQL